MTKSIEKITRGNCWNAWIFHWDIQVEKKCGNCWNAWIFHWDIQVEKRMRKLLKRLNFSLGYTGWKKNDFDKTEYLLLLLIAASSLLHEAPASRVESTYRSLPKCWQQSHVKGLPAHQGIGCHHQAFASHGGWGRLVPSLLECQRIRRLNKWCHSECRIWPFCLHGAD